jgi:hypothetical protein
MLRTTGAKVIKDKVLVGSSGGEYCTRGHIDAVDFYTRQPAWRVYTVPKSGEPGSDTWESGGSDRNVQEYGYVKKAGESQGREHSVPVKEIGGSALAKAQKKNPKVTIKPGTKDETAALRSPFANSQPDRTMAHAPSCEPRSSARPLSQRY